MTPKSNRTKKITSGAISFGFALVAMAIPLTQAYAATPWDVSGNYVAAEEYLGGTYPHDMFLTQDAAGNVTGNGGNPVGGPYSYSWHVSSGVVIGNTITLTLAYDTGAVGTTEQMTGTIAANGSISGNWSDDYLGQSRTGTWQTTSGAAVLVPVPPSGPTNMDQCKNNGWKTFSSPSFKNQGQCVSYTNHL
jgi:hypothetical protein